MEESTVRVSFPSFLEHRGLYNIAPGAISSLPLSWNTRPALPPLTREEFINVKTVVERCVSKHGQFHKYPGLADFFVSDETPPDRTVRIEVLNFSTFRQVAVELTHDLGEVLRRFALWRVMLDADVPDEVLLIYPGSLRLDCNASGEPDDLAIRRISTNRLARWEARERHRRATLTAIKTLIPQCFRIMDRKHDRVGLLAAFSTLSEPFLDWRAEGRRGPGVWLMFRDLKDYHFFEYSCIPPVEGLGFYWALPNGELLKYYTPSVPAEARLLWSLEVIGDSGLTLKLMWQGTEYTFRYSPVNVE